MPPGGAQARAEQKATLQEMAHKLFTSDEMGTFLDHLAPLTENHAYDSDEASLVRVTAREYEKRRRIPPDLVAERARVSTLAHSAWENARQQADFELFQPHLERLVDLSVRIAQALGYSEHIYDALLDLFEPQMKTSTVTSIFEKMKNALVPFVQRISSSTQEIDDNVLRGNFAEEKQWELGQAVLARIGFDPTRGRQDLSVHPFTTAFSPDDVRLTTRINPRFLASGLFGTIHEGGHALYEQGIPTSLVRTPLCDGASMSVHESQSRMWENIVGRSRPFWQFWLPELRQSFPDHFQGVDQETLYRAVNRVAPGFIRVEADEVTYNLHIFVRFELETALLEGTLQAQDLPDAWNAKMESYLGLTPPNDALGVLQDVHWSGALFGYFPTYALGNLLAVQFYNQAVQEHPEIPDRIAQGDFTQLLMWLRERIHKHGARYTPQEIVLKATGTGIDAAPFVDYIQIKYAEIYGL
jgi:carboxypeptidase Taq